MDTSLFEDLIALATTRSFRRAAEQRHVTQSAFSRRIRNLERWAGADLVDRSRVPTQLTPAGQMLRWRAEDALQCIQFARDAMCQCDSSAGHGSFPHRIEPAPRI